MWYNYQVNNKELVIKFISGLYQLHQDEYNRMNIIMQQS